MQNQAVQALQAAAAGVEQRAQQSASPAPGPAAQPSSSSQQAGPSTTAQVGPAPPATATSTVGSSQATPQPAVARTPAVPAAPHAAGARGLAQVLEPGAADSDERAAGRITSAMFGSAMQAALAAAQQVRAVQTCIVASCVHTPVFCVGSLRKPC